MVGGSSSGVLIKIENVNMSECTDLTFMMISRVMLSLLFFLYKIKIIKTEFLEHKKTITTKKPTVFGEKIFHATIYDLK